VRRRFPHALVVQHQPPSVGERVSSAVTAAHDPLEVAADFVEHVTGGRPSEAEAGVLRSALEHVVALERSA
jgi:DNA repair protein SbcD/Mre11